MILNGLFIGIDRYASPAINWLSCARRDAVALHSLFADNLGGNTKLLTDKDATRAAIETEFNRLTKCKEDDLVVVSFSGHGTETHEIVTYDADRSNLLNTCIPLNQLAEWFSKIPTKRLVCVLDCCFSGGMGAKALQVDVVSRELTSAEELLKQLSGEGRLILTASRANERAWENQKLGHGLLTYHLLTAMQGAEEVKKAGKIGIYRLLEYVTERVIDSAAKIGKLQNPTLLGKIDGSLTLPIFTAGKLYVAAFPERTRQKITTDIKSLEPYGFPKELLKMWAGYIPSLNQLQIDAVNDFGLLDGEHLVVSAPTSSGKTMIGELAAIRGIMERKRAIFLFPLKALVNDKLRHFNSTYGAFGIKTIKATGESTSDDIVPLMRGQYDVCLMTYEKFSALVLGNPYILDQIGTIVVDEVQMIADETRGVNLEFILTLLRMRRREGAEPQLIALSAVIGDTNGLERWLGARLLRRTERPVPLDEGLIKADGSFRYIESDTGQEKVIQSYIKPEIRKGTSQDLIIPLVRKIASENKSVIVFRETRGEARGCALYLASALGLPPAQVVLDTLPNSDPSISSNKLREALSGGVAFHISDLDTEERLLVEEQFRAVPTALKVIAATTTLAMGVNTPAEFVIIAGLTHPGNKPYSVAEYKNIIGRAGRLGFSKRGISYVIALDANEENYIWNNYISALPENLQSKFLADNTDPRSLIVRVLVAAGRAGRGLPSKDIIGFLEESFGAFQKKSSNATWVWDELKLTQSLNDLHSHKLVEQDKDGLYHLTPLGRLAGESGTEVESIIRIVNGLNGVNTADISDPTLIALTQITTELDQVFFPLNKRSTKKEPQTWTSEITNQGIPSQVMQAIYHSIKDATQPTLRAKKAVACLLWVTNKPLKEIEDTMTQFGGKFNGAAGQIRGVVSRTCDILPAVARVAELLNPNLELSSRVSRLLVRLELGIPADIADIGFRIGRILTRGDYLNLLKAGINTVEQFENSTENVLLTCLGNNREKLQQAKLALENYKPEKVSAISLPILPEYKR
ncbi:MAG: DEAD/DEAH box helicase [Elusimicrobiota bacterium]